MEINKEELFEQAKAIKPQKWTRFKNCSSVEYDADGFSVCLYYKIICDDFGDPVRQDGPYYTLSYKGMIVIESESDSWFVRLFRQNPARKFFEHLDQWNKNQL